MDMYTTLSIGLGAAIFLAVAIVIMASLRVTNGHSAEA